MSSGLPRHLLKWVLSLDFTYPIKYPRRDFANGFLVAELLARYYPADVQMHSFSNVHSAERKKNNWFLLSKFFKKHEVHIDHQLIADAMDAKEDAAVRLLQILFDFVHGQDSQSAASLQASHLAAYDMQQTAGDASEQLYSQLQQVQPGMSTLAAAPYQLQPQQQQQGLSFAESQHAGLQQQVQPIYAMPMDTSQWSAGHAANWTMQHQQPGLAMHGGAAYHHQGEQQPGVLPLDPLSHLLQQQPVGPPPGHYYSEQQQAQYQIPAQYDQALQQQQPGAEGLPTIEYDKRPRPVQYRPYTHQEYVERNFDTKTQKGYWMLGKLGPGGEDNELLVKRRRAEEVRELARTIRQENARTAASSAPASRAGPEPLKRATAREKAWEFAKTLPRPEAKRAESASPGRSGSGSPADSSASGRKGARQAKKPLSNLEQLQAQHAAHQQRVEAIRQEFDRLRG